MWHWQDWRESYTPTHMKGTLFMLVPSQTKLETTKNECHQYPCALSLTKYQSRIFMMEGSDQLPLLPTDIIRCRKVLNDLLQEGKQWYKHLCPDFCCIFRSNRSLERGAIVSDYPGLCNRNLDNLKLWHLFQVVETHYRNQNRVKVSFFMWLIAALHSIKVENHHATKKCCINKRNFIKKKGHIRQCQFEYWCTRHHTSMPQPNWHGIAKLIAHIPRVYCTHLLCTDLERDWTEEKMWWFCKNQWYEAKPRITGIRFL